MRQRSTNRRRRTGTAAIEFAAVAPVVFLVVFACIEFGRALMAAQSLEEASRSGCRVAVLRGTTSADIQTEIDRVLGPSGITQYSLATTPADIVAAERWATVTVTINANFNDMTWLPLPRFVKDKNYTASCSLPKEYAAGG